MIHVAVGASAPFPLAVLLVGFGVAELGWGVAASLESGLGVSAEATGLPLYSIAIASLFNLFLAGVMAVHQRRHSAEAASAAVGGTSVARTTSTPATANGWGFLPALTLGGLLFSGLITPALAATDAGQFAVPHGTSHGGH